ncbi:MAG: DUF3592 domain-containing protein [Nakamurella sp.]
MGTDQGVPVAGPDNGDPDAARPAELTAPVRGAWSRRSAHGRAVLVLTAVAGILTGMMLLLGIGMWRNDMVIAATPVRATATVLTVSAVSTGIEFVDNTGVSQRPPNGVLYPGGLTVGQQFVVEYAASDPTLARVAGRSAVNGLIMPLLVVAGTWLLIGPLLGVLRWRENRMPGPAPVRGRLRRRWRVRPARSRR